MKLEGNTILITGGTAGIGLEFAKRLLEKKNTVIITGRDPKKLEAAKAQLPGVITIQSDAGKVSDIKALCDKVTKDYPALNILINNAGVMQRMNFQRATEDLDELTAEIDVNFKGPVRMIRRLLPHLKKQSAPAIVNISSGLAFVPLPLSPIYCATKAALHSFSLSLRVQLAKTPIKVFEVCPPATETQLLTSTSSAEDLKGVTVMKVTDMVATCLKGFEGDKYEIRPGQANQLRFMSRVAPDFILGQLSKPVERMLNEQPN